MKTKLVLWCLILVMLFSGAAFARTQPELAVILVIDQSTSMLETDPNQYRFASADLLIDILGADDRLGMISFASEVSVLHELEVLGSDRQRYHEALLEAEPPGGNTDYVLALDKARDMLLQKADAKQAAVVFLTDGDPYPGPQVDDAAEKAKYLTALDLLVDQLALENIAVYTVGFGGSSGEILQPISAKTRALAFIDAQPQTIAGHFFDIVSSLKGRDSLVEEVLSGQAGQYSFTLDANTTQLNTLVLGSFSGEWPVLSGPISQTVSGISGEGFSSFIVDRAAFEQTGTWTLDVPPGDFTVKVARDTKVSWEILSPAIQSEYSEQGVIDLAARLYDSDPEVIVEARLLLNDTPQTDWLALEYKDGLYQGQLSDLTGSGSPAVEFQARQAETVLSAIKIPIHIKRIPELHIELRGDETSLVGESEVSLSAWLTRHDKILTSQQVDLESFQLVRGSRDQGIDILSLHDDGTEGDLFKDDGIYSVKFRLSGPGELEGEIQAKGSFGDEAFQLTKILEGVTIQQPGLIEINLNQSRTAFEMKQPGRVEIPLKLKNYGDYREIVAVQVRPSEVTILNPLFRLEAGEDLVSVLQLEFDLPESQFKPLEISFSPSNPATVLSLSKAEVEVFRKGPAEARQESLSLMVHRYGQIGVLALMIAIGVVIARGYLQHRREKTASHLKGVFQYRKGDNDWQSLELSGTSQRIAIGHVTAESDHQLPGKELGFILTIKRKPGGETDTEVGYQLHCNLPGVIIMKGVVASSFEVSAGEPFGCGGYECVIQTA